MTEKAISLPFGFNESGGISFTTDIKKIFQDRVVMVVMTSLGSDSSKSMRMPIRRYHYFQRVLTNVLGNHISKADYY
jgi:hypothetical protein